METFPRMGMVIGITLLVVAIHTFIFIYQERKMERESDLKSYVISCIATINFLLRRTLVRSVILLNNFDLF